MTVRSEAQALPGLALTWRQFGALAGIIGVVLFVAGVLVQGDVPTTNDPVSEAQTWYADNGQTYLVGDYVIALGVVLGLLPFFVVLRSVLVEAEGGQGHWGHLAYVSAIFFLILGAAASSFTSAIAVAAGDFSDDTVRALQYADSYAFGGLSIVLVPLYLATAIVTLRTGVFWAATGWLALLLAVLATIGAAEPIDGDPEGTLALVGFLSFIGLGVLVLAVSANLLARRSEPYPP